MNLSLSKGDRPASVKNRAWHYCQMAWRGVCNQKALSRLAAFSPLLLLGMGQMAHATDLLAGGKDDVKATFGADSFVIMCIYIAEIVIGVATYKRARRLKKLPVDQQIYEMSEHLRKCLPPDEAYFCSDDHLKRLAIRELRQLELTLAAPPPH